MNEKKPNHNLNVQFVRKQFPALDREFIFMDNAGGAQVPESVINRITEYLTNYNVQLGASYKVSAQATEKLDQVMYKLAELVNAPRKEEIIVGPSSTMLLRILSICLARGWQPGDEVIVTNSDHEANVSCWMDLQKLGIHVKTWKINPETFEFDLDDLQHLLTKKTKLVAMVHASNILGTINPIKKIADTVHHAGALFCIDGVAYAPHRMVDVQEFDVDFYVYSFYKTFGPHLAVMYGKYEFIKELDGLNHYFIGKDEVPYKFQPGNFNYELSYGLNGIFDYFNSLHSFHFQDLAEKPKREKIFKNFQLIATHEEKLTTKLLDYLNSIKEVKIIGRKDADHEKRVSTISFVHHKFMSSEVVGAIDKFGIGIRYGDFYAKKIIQDLGLINKDGVIRVSMVHYNSLGEVDKLIGAFEEIFA
jgi:cysteine desulfurase family protein (TIGR01976 family)